MGTHVTDESWFSRIGGAIKGILVGGIMILVAPILLFWNEGRAVKTAKGLKEGARVVESISADTIDPDREGKLVHITDEAKTAELLRDEQFGVEFNGIRLNRNVETYQWKEHKKSKKKKKLGGGTRTTTTYSYTKEWHRGLIDSTRFDEADSHRNPTSVPYQSTQLQAKLVNVGQFKLPDNLISSISGSEPVTIAPEQLPADIASRASLGEHKGSTMIYLSADSTPPASNPQTGNAATQSADAPLGLIDLSKVGTDGQPSGDQSLAQPTPADGQLNADAAAKSIPSVSGEPKLGDTRVWFTATPVATVSLMSKQYGDTFQPYDTQSGTQLHRLEMGSATAADMIKHAEHENSVMTWVLRGVGSLVVFIGFTLLMRPLVVLADVVPIFGSLVGFGTALIAGLLAIVVSFTTIGVAWLFYRPLLGGTLLAVSCVCLFLIFRRARAAASSRRDSQAETLTEMDLV